MKVFVLLCCVAVTFAGREYTKTCVEKPETGMCEAYFRMWYYDPETEKCHKFVYGGCQGNGNRYASEVECLENCNGVKVLESDTSFCALEPETGMCRGYFPRFHYDAATGKCKEFIYGGCGGNKNNFESEKECHKTCGSAVTLRLEGRPDCGKKGETGPCKGSFPRFYYDQEEGMCKKFIYGGCGGNKNNFETEAECQNGCGALLSESPCAQEKLVGPCKAAVPRYFFNKQSGQCEFFIYGGCSGNSNNFEKKEDCESTCSATLKAEGRPDCEKKGDTGPCKGSFPRFYYDQEEGMCKKFIYGGCGGNKNNFETEAECQNGCGALLSESPCDQEKVVGPCKAAVPSYFFNKQSGQCEFFIYGGCSGNANRFANKEHCEQTCQATLRLEGRPDCEKKGETGPCRGSFPRYYYDQEEGMCKKFIYGGCGGNKNNFETEAECQNGCGALLSESPCDQEKVVGPCKAAVPSYFFNKQSGQCEFFIYGGCSGNANRFANKEHCEQTCQVTLRLEGRPDCEKKGETGPCRGSFPRFYYDQEEGMCKKFIYGGCGGNKNNFETEAECENGCGALLSESPCDQEKVIGPCKAAFPSYFFNKQSGQCEFFIYGGCSGNANRFPSKEHCEQTCLA